MPFWGWILIFFAGVILLGALSDWRMKQRRKYILTEHEFNDNALEKIEDNKQEHTKNNHFHGV